MKVSNRNTNYFNGSYYGYHDEMDAKTAPLSVKVVFALMMLVVPIGVVFALYNFNQDNIEGFVITILSILIVEFPLIHLFAVLFDKAKYGKVRPQAKVIGSIFTSVAALILIGVILSRFIHFIIVCAAGTLIIFLSIGIGLCIGGSRKLRRAMSNCTSSIWAVCVGYETLHPHMPILNDRDATYAQNDLIARTEVRRPVWEFTYNGRVFHVSPNEYQGKLNFVPGRQYQIFINPQNPNEIYCEDGSDAKSLIRMGRFWLIFTLFISALMVALFMLIPEMQL